MTTQTSLLTPAIRHFLLWTAGQTACGQALSPLETLLLQLQPITDPECPACRQSTDAALQATAARGYSDLSPASALLLHRKLLSKNYFWKRRWGPAPEDDPPEIIDRYRQFAVRAEEAFDDALFNHGRHPKRAWRIAWNAAAAFSQEWTMMLNEQQQPADNLMPDTLSIASNR